MGWYLRPSYRTVPGTGKKTPGGAGTHTGPVLYCTGTCTVPVPVKRHLGEPGHTQISITDRTRLTPVKSQPRTGPTREPDPSTRHTTSSSTPIRDTSDKGGRAHTQANGSHRTRTSQPSKPTNTRTSQPCKPTNTPARPRDEHRGIRGARRNSRRPAAQEPNAPWNAPRGRLRRGRPQRTAASRSQSASPRLLEPLVGSRLAGRRHARRGRRNMKARAADAQQTRSGRRCGRSPR